MLKITTNFEAQRQRTKVEGKIDKVMGEMVFAIFEQMIPEIEVNSKDCALMLCERIDKLSKEKIKELKKDKKKTEND